MPLVTGTVLNNRYRIVSLLGQGGFGAVYRAWDLHLGHACAVKENLERTPAARRQFETEARLVSMLRHPNLPVVIDHFILPGQGQYLVMDFVEGEDLQAKLDRAKGPLPEAQVVDWTGQVSDALAYLHRQKPPVIHRDVKPKNIIVTPQGQAMLVDFGISKVFDPTTSTTEGAQGVTDGYSPVEQYAVGATGPYSDVYALGATLYALLTGQAPPSAIRLTTGQDVLRPVQNLNPAVSPRLNAVIETAMQMDRRRRYPTAAEFRAALTAPPPPAFAATRQQSAVPLVRADAAPLVKIASSGAVPDNRPGGRRLWALGAAGLAVVGLILAAVWNGIQADSRRAIQTAGARAPDATGTAEIRSTPATETEAERVAGATGTAWPATALAASPTETPTPSFTPTATSTPGPGATRVALADGMVQVFVPAGKFLMGSTDADDHGESYEKPHHTVYLDAFWIDRTEVTNEMYARCVAAGDCRGPYKPGSAARSSYYGDPQYADYPVIYVSWEDARSYCAWAGRELPTEAQWEKAARGEDGRFYPWGDAPPDCSLASYDQCSGGDTQAAGSYSQGASPYGVQDMAGNVREWVADWYDENYYNYSPSNNPAGPETGTYRVLRGGSWRFNWKYLRSANRNYNDPTVRYNYIGFRCGSPPGG